MKWWIMAVMVFVGLVAWCWLNLTPAARRKRVMFNRRSRDRTNWKDIALTSRVMPPMVSRDTPPPPESAADYMDVS